MFKYIRQVLASRERLGRYPSCDHLNQALGWLLMDYETNRFAIEEICHAIRKADGYFYGYIASLMHVYGFDQFLKGQTSMRPIDADALKPEMVSDLANTMRMQEMHKGDMAVRVLNKIDEAPTIDAVSVVRCRDCVNRRDIDFCPMYHIKRFDSFDVPFDSTEDDGFCHRGEKTDGDPHDSGQ